MVLYSLLKSCSTLTAFTLTAFTDLEICRVRLPQGKMLPNSLVAYEGFGSRDLLGHKQSGFVFVPLETLRW